MRIRVNRLALLGWCVGMGSIVAMDRYGWPIIDQTKTFLALIKNPKLDYAAFSAQAHQYFGINMQDSSGYTAMHYLLSHPNVTERWVDDMLVRGARLDICSHVYRIELGAYMLGVTPYQRAVLSWSRTPNSEDFTLKRCDNRRVLRHVFNIVLYKKLEQLSFQPVQLKHKTLQELALLVEWEEQCLQ